MTKWTYGFGGGKAEGRADLFEKLGGDGGKGVLGKRLTLQLVDLGLPHRVDTLD